MVTVLLSHKYATIKNTKICKRADCLQRELCISTIYFSVAMNKHQDHSNLKKTEESTTAKEAQQEVEAEGRQLCAHLKQREVGHGYELSVSSQGQASSSRPTSPKGSMNSKLTPLGCPLTFTCKSWHRCIHTQRQRQHSTHIISK